MREEEYRYRIDWLWTRAEEFQVFAKSIHHHRSRAAMVRLAQTYANTACELEDLLERKLLHERGIGERPDFSAVASRGDRVDG
jgi:hypothetical protein